MKDSPLPLETTRTAIVLFVSFVGFDVVESNIAVTAVAINWLLCQRLL